MAQFVNIYPVDLQKGPVEVSLNRMYMEDIKANRVVVTVTDGGAAVTLGGTCSGTAILSNGSTVAISGTISGNQAYIELPSAVYTVEGPVEVFVNLTNGGVTATLLHGHGTVVQTDTGTVIDPGTIIPSVSALIADIDSAVASIPADYSALLAAVAPTFSSSTVYTAGRYVWNSGNLYRFTADHAAGSWTGTDAVQVVVTNEIADLKSASDQIAETANQILYTNGSNYDTTYRTLTIKRSGYDVTIDGTSDATIKIKISGSLQTAISSSYPDSWSKTVPLLQGHRYRISTAILSGTVSENKPALYIVDSDNAKISSKSIDQTYEIDGNGKNVLFYVYVPSGYGGTNLTFRVTVVDVTELYLIHEEIDTEKSVSLALATGKLYSYSSLAVGSAVPDGTSTSNGKYGTQDISFSAGGGEIELEIDSITASSTTGFAIADENSIVLSKYVTSDEFVLQENGKYKAVITVGSKSAKYLYFSVYKGSSPLSITMSKPDASNQRHVRWVSPTGSDDNDGTDSNHAFATINKAIADGGHTIMLGGGVYRQSIDLSLAVDNLRIISASRYTQPVICATNSLISESEEAVANTTKVYSCPCTKTFDDKNIWIFQDGVADAGTEITAEDRHPLQRGKPYRCPDTKIVRCSASTTEAAIAEIEAASGYKWFIDSTNHVLYFSRPQEITSSNPLCGSFGSSLFTGTQRALQFEMTGVGVKYQKINLMGLASPILTDCFVGNVRSEAGIQYDGSAGAKLYRCEAFRVFYSTTSGDGINAHSETTGDTFAKQTTCFQIDCWSHDNCDDGYSDHERCETTIIGGLYEFNGAGVTPAQGSHCTCYNVLSRYNGEADFFYTGNPSSAEGGVGGQIACYGCVAKGNGTSNTKGYRLNGSAVRGLFVGCVAIGEGTGFYGESSATGTLINCSTINCTTAKTSHYTAYSGSPVT